MEIGCGSGLVGLVAGLFGAKEVCFTDCDDRALVRLKEYLAEVQRVRHGEEKEKDASSASGYNLITSAADKQCDVMLISDCLYFSSQEDPLVAVLRRRLRRPHGQALILIQERSSGGVQMERFVEKLLAAEPVDDPRVDRAEPEDSSPAGTSERLCFSVTELREEEVGDWKDHLKYVCQTTSSGLVEELQTDTDHQADNFIAMTGFERKSHILRVGFATTKNVK
eukprot:g1900.t1